MFDGVLPLLREARRCRSDAERARRWAQSINNEGDRTRLEHLAEELDREAVERDRLAEEAAHTILRTRNLIADLEILKSESKLLLAQARKLIEKN